MSVLSVISTDFFIFCSELAMAFKVQAVPTVMAVKGGKVVDGFMGMKDDDQLKTFVNKVIAA